MNISWFKYWSFLYAANTELVIHFLVIYLHRSRLSSGLSCGERCDKRAAGAWDTSIKHYFPAHSKASHNILLKQPSMAHSPHTQTEYSIMCAAFACRERERAESDSGTERASKPNTNIALAWHLADGRNAPLISTIAQIIQVVSECVSSFLIGTTHNDAVWSAGCPCSLIRMH